MNYQVILLFFAPQTVFSTALPSPHLASEPQEINATMEIKRETKQLEYFFNFRNDMKG